MHRKMKIYTIISNDKLLNTIFSHATFIIYNNSIKTDKVISQMFDVPFKLRIYHDFERANLCRYKCYLNCRLFVGIAAGNNTRYAFSCNV